MGWFDRENEVDEFFKEGLDVKYPYNPLLWARLASILDSKYTKLFLFNGLLGKYGLLLVILPLFFFNSNNPIAKRDFQSSKALIENYDESIKTNQYNSFANNKTKPSTLVESNILFEEQNSTNIENKFVTSAEYTADYRKTEVLEQSQINYVKTDIDAEEMEYKTSFINSIERNLNFATIHELYAATPISIQSTKQLLSRSSDYQKPSFDIAVVAEQSFQLSNRTNENPHNGTHNALSKTSYGLELLESHKSFRFGLGLRVSEFAENVSYSNTTVEQGYQVFYDTTYSVVNSNYDENGNPVILIKQEINARVEESSNQRINQERVRNVYRRIQIPVTIGFEKSIGKFFAGIRSGMIINYAYAQNGVYYNKKSNQYKELRDDSKQMNTYFMGHMSRAEIGYKLNPTVALGASYSYEADLGSFRTDINSQFQSQNIGIWLRWNPFLNYSK